jgi:hypothetical protein
VRFDAYAGSIRGASPQVVVDVLAHVLAGEVDQGPSLRRYGQTLQVTRGGVQAVWVGHDDANDLVYFEGKGETSPILAEGVRKHFPGHAVARADVCLDLGGPQAFEATQSLIRSTKGGQAKGAYVRLPDDAEEGRTWAVGSRGAPTYLRLYEAGKMPERRHLCRPDWVRCELEARPHYAVEKAAAAVLEPLAFWGLSKWAGRVGKALTGSEIPRFEAQHEPSYVGTTAYIARTFRNHLQGLLDDGIHLESTLREIWRQDDETARRWAELRRHPPSRKGGD